MNARPLLLVAFIGAARADARSDALDQFKIGVALSEKKDFAGALVAFEKSRELFPTKGALANIATCLRELGRYDEAYDRLAELGEDTAAIARWTGFVSVRSDAPGAQIFVDGRLRGTDDKPIRVSVGTRKVRVEKEGFAPFESTVIVPSGETRAIDAHLAVVARLGHLRVVEAHGNVIDVRLDGVAVGRTPWEGDVSIGEHAVSLSGEHDVGSLPKAVHVELGKTETVSIESGVLPAELRVETTPTNAQVRLDGAFVSVGTWTGTPSSGSHAVDVSLPWYEPKHVDLALSSKEPSVVRVELDPIHRVYVELWGGATAYSAYDTPAVSCSTCTGWLLGIRGGFLLTRQIGLEVFVVPHMDAHRSDAVWDATLNMSYGGGSVKLQLFDRWPLTFRFMAGLALGTEYYGRFWSPIAGPEVRFGYRASRTVIVDVGAGALFFYTPRTGEVGTIDGGQGFLIDSGIGATFPITLGLHADL